MKFRKLIWLLPALCFLLCIALTGCSGGAGESEAQTEPETLEAAETPSAEASPQQSSADPEGSGSTDPEGASAAPQVSEPPEVSSDPAAAGPYLLRVNKDTNVVTAYAKDSGGAYTVPVRAMICSTGENTPSGTFTLTDKGRWGALVHNTYGQYYSRITGAILFHTVPALWMGEDGVEAAEFNKLGTTCSAGCVRLITTDCYWIYTNCGSDETTVEIGYYGEDGDPLGKPEVIKLPTDTETNWDPYDISPDNPWNDKTPWLEGVHDMTLDAGSGVPNWLDGVTGYDTCGNDWTSHIEVTGDVDLNTPGTYTLTYTLTDLLGRTVQATAAVTVNPVTSTLGLQTAISQENLSGILKGADA